MSGAVAAVIGAVVVVSSVLVMAIAMAFGVAMWETWWLHPTWAWVAEPLGVPSISYWQLFALNLFVSVMWFVPAHSDYAKEPDKATRVGAQVARLAVAVLRPVTGYYIIRWALS